MSSQSSDTVIEGQSLAAEEAPARPAAVSERPIGLRRAFMASFLVASALSVPISLVVSLLGIALTAATWADGINLLMVAFDASVLALWVPCMLWLARLRPRDIRRW